jgi:hypothetical protein
MTAESTPTAPTPSTPTPSTPTRTEGHREPGRVRWLVVVLAFLAVPGSAGGPC